MYRGSRKHVLDWTEKPTFVVELLDAVSPIRASVTASSAWMPRGYRSPDEARLDSFGPAFLPDHEAWSALQKWWLRHERGANTPNWDLALACEIESQPGLVLVEAKAHKLELKPEGKVLDPDASQNSRENHDQIRSAIRDGRQALLALGVETGIDRDTHYQLSNRIAFTWKLASLGIPTVLVYLGFLVDRGISDVGPPFADEADWREAFWSHATHIVPDELFERRLDIGKAPAWFLVRSRQIHEISPKADS
jgi:hypothetical protein